jgi:hypothetical protein
MAERVPFGRITLRPKREGGLIARGLAMVAAFWRRMTRDLGTDYRPERHYMRGPGPKWHQRNSGGTV